MVEHGLGAQPWAVAHPAPPLTPDNSTAPASPDTLSTENKVNLVLTSQEAKLIEKFRQEIRLCETDTEKYSKYIQKQDELLEKNDRLVLQLAAFEQVMSVEYATYRGRKERTRPLGSRPRILEEDSAARWDRFVGVAAVGLDTISK